MTQPLLSVIVPVYNSEPYLNRCIDSILMQSFRNFELILVDDGSSDGSRKICNDYSHNDPRIHVYHQSNRGVSSARNTGLKKALGEWIYFMDSDDSILKGCFDIFFRIEEQMDVDMIQFGFKRVKLIKNINQQRTEEKAASNIFRNRDEYSQNEVFSLWVHFIKRSILDKNKITFSPDIRYSEDIEFITKCYLISKKTLIMNKTYYNYYLNKGSASTKLIDVSRVLDRSRVLENLIQFTETAYDINKCPVFIQKRALSFIKSFLVHISKHSSWYLNIHLYQKTYNRMLSISRKSLGCENKLLYLSISRISVIPCVLILILKSKLESISQPR